MQLSIFILVLFLLAPGDTVLAGETSVVNSVSVTASSGGSSASGGSVSEGGASGYTRVYTEVNGNVVEDFEESKSSADGSSVEIKYNKTIFGSSSTSSVMTTSTASSSVVTGTEIKQSIIKKEATGGAKGSAATDLGSIKKTYATGTQQVSAGGTSTASTSAENAPITTTQKRWKAFWSAFTVYVFSFFSF